MIAFDHPYVMFESKKTQILITHQKEKIDRTQKNPATARPRDTRPRGVRTLEIHGFELVLKTLEIRGF